MTTISPVRAPLPVSYTDRIKKSTNANVNAVLAGGNHWWHTQGADGSVPSAVALHTISFSFMSSASGADGNGFQPLSSAQQQRVRDALSYISSVADISFNEVASGGDIQYGSNNQSASAGYARYPEDGSQVLLANNQSSFQGSWSNGSYEWETLLHETAHALGLKHPGAYNAGGGTTPGPYLPAALDNRNNSIMSYHDGGNMQRVVYANNQFSKTTVNPDTFQTVDIAALQYLYGAPTSQAATFSWATDATISQTIFNNNSQSTIDLSNQTHSNVVDLRAGHSSSIAVHDAYADMPFTAQQYAHLTSGGRTIASLLGKPTYTGQNNLKIAAGSHIDHVVGGSGSDTVITNTEGDTVSSGAGDDKVFLTGGDATIDGGDGNDVVYVVKRAGAQWSWSSDHSTLTLTQTDARTHVTSTLATVQTTNVEAVKYWNGSALQASAALGPPTAA